MSVINQQEKTTPRKWTKKDELNLINKLQDEYVDKLSQLIVYFFGVSIKELF